MSFERWEAHLVHARQFLNDSKTEGIFAHTRAFLALQAGELALKALFYNQFPNGNQRGHLSRRLVGDVCHKLDITAPPEIVDAAGRIEKHYNATRYVEDTTKYFCSTAMQVGCWHYTPILGDIISDVETIFDWVEGQLPH